VAIEGSVMNTDGFLSSRQRKPGRIDNNANSLRNVNAKFDYGRTTA